MTVYYQDDQVTLHCGDCRHILPTLPDNSIDAVVTDPPYELGFMGKKWDGSGIAFQTETWELCLRALKPGGHLLAFGGSRTWHRLAVAIEDAGFDVRDSIAWLYGSGFPKSLDVSKAIDKAAGAEREVVGVYQSPENTTGFKGQTSSEIFSTSNRVDGEPRPVTAPATDAAKQWAGWGTALKPAFEPIVVARKPLIGTVAANVLAHGTGALNIDACRVGSEPAFTARSQGKDIRGGNYSGNGGRSDLVTSGGAGRWPTNAVLDHHQAAELDTQSGVTKDGTHVGRNRDGGQVSNEIYGARNKDTRDGGYGGSGGASRFFPTFKYTAKAPGTERPTAAGVSHPTVKPLDLMRWLIRLVTPPDGVVLDPFAGSGTTGEAAIHEHKHAILIEREPTYLPLIVARLSKPMEIGFNFEDAS